ncbi:DUF739 family protein [Apilactobacillus xinyiensis]|uniref:DUF739 family protein n=1 Tax=Apilactobacillus xinyiensis TaxID=2841032 RepID=UPI001C7D0EEB|nr:DUF739 family protein [Apilactobacillus xinyiensis]
MYDFSMLYGRMKGYGNGMTKGELAKIIGVSRPTLNSRLNGKGFYQDEIDRICAALDIPKKEIPQYFFTFKVYLNKPMAV